jgi:hypothetical protein
MFEIQSVSIRYICDIRIVYDVPYVYTVTYFGDNHTALVIKKVGVKEIGPGSEKNGHTERF